MVVDRPCHNEERAGWRGVYGILFLESSSRQERLVDLLL